MIEIDLNEYEIIEGFVMGLSGADYEKNYAIAEQLYAQMVGWA